MVAYYFLKKTWHVIMRSTLGTVWQIKKLSSLSVFIGTLIVLTCPKSPVIICPKMMNCVSNRYEFCMLETLRFLAFVKVMESFFYAINLLRILMRAMNKKTFLLNIKIRVAFSNTFGKIPNRKPLYFLNSPIYIAVITKI